MILTIALIMLAFPGGNSDSERVFVRVVDEECHEIPGAMVTFSRVDGADSNAGVKAVTNTRGEAFLDVPRGSEYKIVASLPGFISVRVGPFTVTKSRASRPVILVLNLSLDSAVVLRPTSIPPVGKKQ